MWHMWMEHCVTLLSLSLIFMFAFHFHSSRIRFTFIWFSVTSCHSSHRPWGFSILTFKRYQIQLCYSKSMCFAHSYSLTLHSISVNNQSSPPTKKNENHSLFIRSRSWPKPNKYKHFSNTSSNSKNKFSKGRERKCGTIDRLNFACIKPKCKPYFTARGTERNGALVKFIRDE